MLREERAEYFHSGGAAKGSGEEPVQAQKAPGARSGAWNGKSTVSLDEWVQAQLARAPKPGPTQRRNLAAILGLDPEG